MKLFISHASKNANYGNALVNLMTGVGVNTDNIIFTSNSAFGIPIGENIFDWLKSRITEKPHVIYLLSPEYYSSVACLNEMGAAWVIENKHTMVFTPNFKLDSDEFLNGAIDPRKIGFFINDFDKLTAFIESLRVDFIVTKNQVLINQKIREFLSTIDSFQNVPVKIAPVKTTSVKSVPEKAVKKVLRFDEFTNEKPAKEKIINETDQNEKKTTPKKYAGKSRFFNDLMNNKLKDEEVILAHYICETAKFKLLTGWQEGQEVEDIIVWEDVNGINNTLSANYDGTLRRFAMKKLTEVSAVTGGGNTKEVQITEEFQDDLLDLSDEIQTKILEVVKNNPKIEFESDRWS
jgi:hypothetical protein